MHSMLSNPKPRTVRGGHWLSALIQEVPGWSHVSSQFRNRVFAKVITGGTILQIKQDTVKVQFLPHLQGVS